MNRPHFRRHPRIAPDSDRGKRPDRADGLTGRTRYDAEWPDVLAAEGGLALGRALDLAVFHGGDLAAMAAPLTDWGVDWRYVDAPADWPPFTGWGEYDIEAEERPVVHYGSVAGCASCAEPVKPRGRHRQTAPVPYVPSTFWARGRHRQTDPLDLILADLRDIEDRLS